MDVNKSKERHRWTKSDCRYVLTHNPEPQFEKEASEFIGCTQDSIRHLHDAIYFMISNPTHVCVGLSGNSVNMKKVYKDTYPNIHPNFFYITLIKMGNKIEKVPGIKEILGGYYKLKREIREKNKIIKSLQQKGDM